MTKAWSVRVPDDVWSIIESHAALKHVSAAEAMSDLVRRGQNQPDAASVFAELSNLQALIKQSAANLHEHIRAAEHKVDALPSKEFIQTRSIFNAEISGTSTGKFGTSAIALGVKAKAKK